MITIKSKHEIELMRKAGEMVGLTHRYLKQYLTPGITTKEIDELAGKYITSLGGVPSSLGYEGYPGNICISINDEVVHGIGGKRKLKEGDIVTLDIVVGYKGYHGDSAWTYTVGEVDDNKKYLMEHTEKALYEGIKQVKPGARIGDISYAVESYATSHNLGVVVELEGHGIGTNMHEDPGVPNYGSPNTGPVLKEGMVICIEPMLTFGDPDIYMLEDNWTIKTEDGLDAAHYEHTVLVTSDGYEILTKRMD